VTLPIPNSYWVLPGKLLAGEHPAVNDPVWTQVRLAAIVRAGVRCFIDLTQAGEMPDYASLLPDGVSYQRIAVRDHQPPDSADVMRAILSGLEAGLASGAAVYIHCFAGIGRTGTAVGCFLRERGASGEEALDELNRLWQQNARAAVWHTVPETDAQHAYVLNWSPAHPAVTEFTAPPSMERAVLSRHLACLVGLAIGDIAAQSGASGVRHWSDETAMAICVAESLLQRQGFDGRDQLERLQQWARDPAAQGAAVDATLRPSVQQALQRALRTRMPLTGSHDPSLIDPAPLARCVAAALFASTDSQRAIELGGDIARVTHQAPLVVDTCRLFTGMLVAALSGDSREAIFAMGIRSGIKLRAEVATVVQSWQAPPGGRRSPPPGILGCLDRAARALLRTESFAEGLTRLLNAPGRDADATLAAYGALAGAYYGEAGLPTSWRLRVADIRRLEDLAARLFRAG
jgi:ADP-ribosylglycohydrolase